MTTPYNFASRNDLDDVRDAVNGDTLLTSGGAGVSRYRIST